MLDISSEEGTLAADAIHNLPLCEEYQFLPS